MYPHPPTTQVTLPSVSLSTLAREVSAPFLAVEEPSLRWSLCIDGAFMRLRDQVLAQLSRQVG